MTDLKNCIRPAARVNLGRAICLFALLQVYFVSNTLSFGFWKSGTLVFTYMLAFYGVWLAGLVFLLSLILAAGRRFDSPWLALAVLVVLSIPFSWELWVRSLEIDNRAVRGALRILLVPAIYLCFRIGIDRPGGTACAILLLCALSLAGHAGFSVSSAPPRDFDTFELDKKTNIHVIMLDSLMHSPFSKEFMGVENPAADYLATLDDAIYAGGMGFSENVPTKQAWGTVFNLGHNLGKGRTHYGYFSGSMPSRLTTLLRANGYSVSTGFSSDYFGWKKGRHVDHYHRGNVQRLDRDLSCTTKKGKLGFCSPFSQSLFSRFLGRESDGRHEGKIEWSDTVIGLIDRAERNATGPLFSAFHIYLPGHARNDYQTGNAEMLAEYKRYFIKRVQRARKVIEDIDRLRTRYPESVFIVSGDHGPFLSRTAPPEERRFIVLDRHGVALALLNASNLCPWSRDWLDRQRYLTPSRMLAASLACNGVSRELTEHFTDNEEFVRFGGSFRSGRPEKR